jgi:hypothetical protein
MTEITDAYVKKIKAYFKARGWLHIRPPPWPPEMPSELRALFNRHFDLASQVIVHQERYIQKFADYDAGVIEDIDIEHDDDKMAAKLLEMEYYRVGQQIIEFVDAEGKDNARKNP